jgi:hypothetical protein
MARTVLILGPVEFQDFELPAAINFGGGQRLAVHQLPDGSRVIDALGRDDADITFRGTFSGSNATLRARALDEMRAAGLPLPLTWDVFLYSVVIKRFEAEYRSSWWVPFCITCTVLRDEASALIEAAASLTAAVLMDVASAATYATVGGIDLSPVQSALNVPGATTPGTSAYVATMASASQADAYLNTTVVQTGTMLSNAAIAAPGSAIGGIAAANAAVTSAGELSSLVTARAYLGRAMANLGNLSS